MPTPSQAGAICDAIIADLASISLPSGAAAVTGVRSYLAQTLLENTGIFTVYAAPASRTSALADRSGRLSSGYRVVLIFQQRVQWTGLAATDNATLDSLVATVEATQDAYARRRGLTVSGQTNVYAEAAEADPLFDPSLLDEQSLFAAVLALTITGWH
jgi:hypothetical protein